MKREFLESLDRFGSGWFANHALQRTAFARTDRWSGIFLGTVCALSVATRPSLS
jgi:hypothetical protein